MAKHLYQPGHPKHGGRKLKSKNKITRDVAELLNKLGVNPIEGMATIAADPKADLPIRARMHAELAKYLHPQLKSVEHSGPAGGPIQVNHTVSARDVLTGRITELTKRRTG